MCVQAGQDLDPRGQTWAATCDTHTQWDKESERQIVGRRTERYWRESSKWILDSKICESCNAASWVDGHKLKVTIHYRSIIGDNKNLLQFDHHEIIVRPFRAHLHAYAIEWKDISWSSGQASEVNEKWHILSQQGRLAGNLTLRCPPIRLPVYPPAASILYGCQRPHCSFVTFNRFVILSS